LNIVLVGFMGSGKTTVGKRLSKKFGMDFLDTDSLVEKKLGLDIVKIFSTHGESKFREVESKVVREIACLNNTVISTGGGAVLNEKNLLLLARNSLVVFLRADILTIKKRLEHSRDRPILSVEGGRKEIPAQLKERLPNYNRADLIVDANKSVQSVVEEISEHLSTPLLCASVSSLEDLKTAGDSGFQIAELRLDLLKGKQKLKQAISASVIPVIATNHSTDLTELEAIEARCEFVDIDIEKPRREKIAKAARRKNCKIISSFHDSNRTPSARELSKILEREIASGDIGKIAVKGNCPEDIDRIFQLLQESKNRDFPMIAFLLGEESSETRVLSPLKGSFLAFCHLGNPTGEGQLSVNEMKKRLKQND